MNTHPDIHAPHELHLRFTRVSYERRWPELAMQELGLGRDELEHLLWDRLLHRELVRSGKQVIVDKTPGNCTFIDRLRTCWPQARFIVLLRHPAAVYASLMGGRDDRDPDATLKEALLYLNAVDQARHQVDSLVIRYEDLVADPVAVTQELCHDLGVAWDTRMLDYSRGEHGTFRAGIGDWSPKIRSGRIQSAAPLPASEDTPPELAELAEAWGYR